MTDPARTAASAAAFDAWLDGFFADVFRRFPIDATWLGEHQHDHALPDYSSSGDSAWTERIRALIASLDTIPAEGLSEAQTYDRILARGALQLWHWETGSPFVQAGNPAVHTSEAIGAVAALLMGVDRLSSETLEASIARMEAIPAFLETARMRLRSVPLSWTELAIRQTDAAVAYFRTGLPGCLAETGNERPDVVAASQIAADAFEEHATWLRNVLAERRTGIPEAGNDALSRYLHQGHLLPATQDPAWWFDYAHAELIEATQELRELARAIDWRAGSRTLVQRLSDTHPDAERYDAAFPDAWEQGRAVAVQARLVDWPGEPVRFLSIAPMEADLWQAIRFPVYRGAPPLQSGGTARAFYPALDRSLPEADQQRILRQTNDARILLDYAIRNAGLGRHVQTVAARIAPTRIGRLAATVGTTRRLFFSGNAISDGWACYAVELMEEAGVLTPMLRLAEAQRRLQIAAQAVADIGLHTGELTFVRVARMYRDEVGLPSSQAMEQTVWISMHPGAGMAELVGAAGIDELRRTIEDRDGPRFDLRAFHDTFLGYGAIPVTLTAASMLNVSGS